MSGLPKYQLLLRSYHDAFEKELCRMLEDLPICSGDAVLDVGCGDGFYSCRLAPLIAPRGKVVAIDILPAYLQRAGRQARQSRYSRLIHFKQADIGHLPFADESFDVAWCAQSLYSMPDPLQAIREIARVVKRGGIVAVLEDDTLHQLLLPWSGHDEFIIRQAQLKSFRSDKDKEAERFFIARNLRELFVGAGLRPQRRKTYALHREFPIGVQERRFLDAYLGDLRNAVLPFLPRREQVRLKNLLTPGHASYLVDQPHFSVTCLDHVLWGKKDNP